MEPTRQSSLLSSHSIRFLVCCAVRSSPLLSAIPPSAMSTSSLSAFVAHPPAPVSPAMRIYRHALEAILGMLKLKDLAPIPAVSREWAAAVRSMKPISARIERENDCPDPSLCERHTYRPLPPVESIVGSALLRHLGALQIRDADGMWSPLTNECLGLLAQHALNLTSLWCTLTLTSNKPLILPAKLNSLHLQPDGNYTDAEINSMLTTVAALPSLSRLHLCLEAFDSKSAMNLSLLTACRSLSDIKLDAWARSTPYFTDIQVEQIRLSLGHLRRCDVGWMNSNELARYLQPPVTVRWQDIGPVYVDRENDLSDFARSPGSTSATTMQRPRTFCRSCRSSPHSI